MYVYKNGTVPKDIVHAKAKFRDAARTVAKELQITESTVRDKCPALRRLGLPGVNVTTDTFLTWLCNPKALQNHLSVKFPQFEKVIHQRFVDWLAVKTDEPI